MGLVQKFLVCFAAVTSVVSFSESQYLVKLHSISKSDIAQAEKQLGTKLELVSKEGRLFKSLNARTDLRRVNAFGVEYIARNFTATTFRNPSLDLNRAKLLARAEEIKTMSEPAYPDNPAFVKAPTQKPGGDPKLADQWGMISIGAPKIWKDTKGGKDIVVAVIDTGVDYTHEDLVANMWVNKNEIADDKIDNDNNGYVDDVGGWDFVKDDNKPYDLSMPLLAVVLEGGNPGHGTHCAGMVGARGNNSLGISGVAPKVSIMALRGLGEQGQGDGAGLIKAIDYATDNGANVISASWGFYPVASPEFPQEEVDKEIQALREAIERARDKGVIFVAAAGNGKSASAMEAPAGVDNDSEDAPNYPSSYDLENVVSVAAIDAADGLAAFSNYGEVSVDIGAPGVKVMSTVPGNRYQDTLLSLGTMEITWDGTSMATPHVAGALAVIWSEDKNLTWSAVRERLFQSATAISALSNKVSTGGKLDFASLF